MAMGEYFMRQGRDALVIVDDLSQHARAYRELSLLLGALPDAKAFPEISSTFTPAYWSARPIFARNSAASRSPLCQSSKPKSENLAAYIPTNRLSITDGQIYLTPTLFQKGILPAVDSGNIGVARRREKRNCRISRGCERDLKLSYSQFEELEVFSRFGTRLDEHTRKTLARGRAVREALKQPLYSPLPAAVQIAILLAPPAGCSTICRRT